MGDLLIRDIPEAMKRRISERAERSGRSLSDEVKQLIVKGMTVDTEGAQAGGQSAWAALRAILAPVDAKEALQFAEVMDEIEAERKKDFGRPVEDFE